MERYVVFIREMTRGEEFVSAKQAASGMHEQVLAEMRQKYPAPKFQVYTTYTETELQDTLSSLTRWCGPQTKDMDKTTQMPHFLPGMTPRP